MQETPLLDEVESDQETDVDEKDADTLIDIIDETEDVRSKDVFNALHEFSDNMEDDIILPKHFRCAAHVMSLIGDVHLHKIKIQGWTSTQSNTWERIWGKFQAIWTRQSKSSFAANRIKELMGKLFLRPSLTRWNSILDAVADFNKAVSDQENKKKLKEIIESFKEYKTRKSFKFFTDNELEMIDAYVKVFKPLAASLDTIQGEEMIYGGMLLPTICILERNIEKMKTDVKLKCMKPVILHLLKEMKTHFKMYKDEDDFYLATAFHPSFKLSGIKRICEEKLNSIQNKMVEILVRYAIEDEPIKEAEETDMTNAAKKSKRGFFDQLWDTPGEKIQEVI